MNTHVPPIIITFVSSKGGSGKSTNCLSLAAALAHRGEPVHIVDLDQTQTLLRWYTANPTAQAIQNLTVEQGPLLDESDPDKDSKLAQFIKNTWHNRSGYVLLDLAGALTDEALKLGVFADITITPAKLSEPDISEAVKLTEDLHAIAKRCGKPIHHRILLNEIDALFSNADAYCIDQIDRNPDIMRFQTIINKRTPFREAFLNGLPPHYADQKRPAVKKAVDQVDHLLAEIDTILAEQQQEQEQAA